MSSVYIRYLLPALVIAACAIFAFFSRRRRRRRTAVVEHSHRIVGAALTPAPTDPAAERAWHQLHAPELEAWLATHEHFLDRASADSFTDAQAALEVANAAPTDHIDAAVAAHPNPLRRAGLSALLAAARSTLVALEQADYARARRHHLVYRDYREIWRQHVAAAGDA